MFQPGSLQRTPLFQEQLALGARMVPFAGWEMPVQFEGVLKEHEANRKGCSIFDCSHMGEFIVRGDARATGLDRVVTQAVADMPVKTCRYGMALNQQGGVIDDLIVYRIEPEKWMVVVNAGNIRKDAAHFIRHLAAGCFEDASALTAKLDVQGPFSRDVLRSLIPDIGRLVYYTFDVFEFLGEKVIVSRTGYTGELGYEIYCSWGHAEKVWAAALADKRVRPTGLGVRDVLRIEMGYPLYGHELNETITPFEAGLRRFVDFSKDFIGRDALLKQGTEGLARKIVCFTAESRRAPRQGHGIFSPDGERVGDVVSGTFSPALDRGIGIGFLKKEFTKNPKKFKFGNEKFKQEAGAVPRPFYTGGSLKS